MSDATAALDRVLKLVALATDPAATEDEARTAAFLACRLIRQHRLLDRAAPRPAPPPPPPPPPPPQREEARHGGGHRAGRFMRSRYQGTCKWCHGPYQVGDLIYWRGHGAGSDHEECAQERFDVEGSGPPF